MTERTPGAVTIADDGHTRRVGKRGLEIVENLAAEGLADVSIAKALRMSRHTFRHVRKRDPAVQQALDRGRGALADELTDILLKQARKGNTVAAIFLAKCRGGFREDGSSPDADRKVNVTINLPGPMSPDDYDRLVDVTPDPALLPAPEDEE